MLGMCVRMGCVEMECSGCRLSPAVSGVQIAADVVEMARPSADVAAQKKVSP